MENKIQSFPSEMVTYPHWICWGVQMRDGKETKIPYSPHGGLASVDDPKTWGTFEQASRYLSGEKNSNLLGLGFVFSNDDPFCGIDLDKCLNPQTDVIDSDMQKIVDGFASYAEISPSGRGVHIIIKGKKKGAKARKGKIEIYDTGRYFTMTGNALNNHTVENRQESLDKLYDSLFAQEEKKVEQVKPKEAISLNAEGFTAKPCPVQPSWSMTEGRRPLSPLDDQTLIEKAKNAKDGAKFAALWEGDISGYPSHSEADLALCSLLAFWTGGDYDRIDRLFRQSGLYREKWEREDYHEMTINVALENTTEYYDPNKQKSQKSEQHKQEVTPKHKSAVVPPPQWGAGVGKGDKVRDEKRMHHLLFLVKRYILQKLRFKKCGVIRASRVIGLSSATLPSRTKNVKLQL